MIKMRNYAKKVLGSSFSKNIFANKFKIPSIFHFNISKSFSKSYRDNKSNTSPDEPFPKFDKKDFYDEHDLIINIGEKETFKGMLVICPTPIGNLNDISIRQYEALKNGDILACEDTRKTGKLLELVELKKMKEKFYSEFGLSFEDFVNSGGLDMTDEQIKNEFFAGKKSKDSTTTTTTTTKEGEENKSKVKENYHQFYETKEDVDKLKDFQKEFKKKKDENSNNPNNDKINENENPSQNQTEQEQKIKKTIYKKTKSFIIPKKTDGDDFFSKLTERVDKKLNQKNPFGELNNIVKEVNLNFSEEDPKGFIKELKKQMEDPVTSDFYSQVKNSEDFFKRKAVIENSEEDLKPFVESLAEDYDDKLKLSYKLRNKAKFLMGMSKKYDKRKEEEKEDADEEDNGTSKEEQLEEEMSLHMGLEDNYFGAFKRKIKEEKDKKGRGLLVPFNQENEEKKIPKLIRAMKLGLRVVLVSDAGTPTISDPGYKLVKEASKNGIIIEPLPGPSAVITALSACALPTDKFLFVGYIPKNPNDKIKRLEEVKKMGVTTVFFESPNRIKRTMETLTEIYGPGHEVYLGLELTKKFENHIYGTIETVNAILDKKEEVKGEITLILAPYLKNKDQEDNEKNLNDEVKLEALEFARKVNSILKLSDKDMRNLLTEVCNISTIKANKIINLVKERESSIKTFWRKTGVRMDKIDTKPIESFFTEENEGEGKTKNIIKVIKRKKGESPDIKKE